MTVAGEENPAAPPTTPDKAAPPTLRPRDVLLLEFLKLQDHDAAPPTCPVCGYNVRALVQPRCPECRQELTLAVGAANLHLGWLFAAVAPGFFSGVAAAFVLIPTLGRPLFGDGRWEPIIVGLDLFGWCSAIVAILFARKRGRVWFLALPLAKQRMLAIMMWAIHIAALGLFVFLAIVYF